MERHAPDYQFIDTGRNHDDGFSKYGILFFVLIFLIIVIAFFRDLNRRDGGTNYSYPMPYPAPYPSINQNVNEGIGGGNLGFLKLIEDNNAKQAVLIKEISDNAREVANRENNALHLKIVEQNSEIQTLKTLGIINQRFDAVQMNIDNTRCDFNSRIDNLKHDVNAQFAETDCTIGKLPQASPNFVRTHQPLFHDDCGRSSRCV